MAVKTRAPKSTTGRYFEDFMMGQVLEHANPRTITSGDVSIYHALTGNSFALQSSDQFARSVGYNSAPVDDFLVFNMVFGLSVDDVSKTAVANLGYAECDFLSQVSVGDTLSVCSTVIGLRETSNGETGVVYVRTEGFNQRGLPILRFARWVLVPKRDAKSPAPAPVKPELADSVTPLTVPAQRLNRVWDDSATGCSYRWEDYEAGERIDHVDGATIEDAEHVMAARLYQNSARAHIDDRLMKERAFGRRVVYGGHVISLVRALSRNGLANGCIVAAIHGGKHPAPVFAGDTIYGWSEIVETQSLRDREDIGALRIVTRAIKNRPAAEFPTKGDDVVLELDYTLLMPRSG